MFILGNVFIFPSNFHSIVDHFNSFDIFRQISGDTGTGLDLTGGDDDVVGAVNKRMLQFAEDISKNFRGVAGLVEEDVKLCIMEAKTHEVVVTIVAKINRDEIVFRTEMLQKR